MSITKQASRVAGRAGPWIAPLFLPLLFIAIAVSACTVGEKASPPSPAPWPTAIAKTSLSDNSLPLYGDCVACHVSDGKVVKTKPVPQIPHTVSGNWTECTFCHASNRIAPLPTSHAGLTDADCQDCHQLSPNQPPQIDHPILQQACSTCHGKLLSLPASHIWRSDLTCQVCHQISNTKPPAVPHSLKLASESCSDCHNAAKLGALPAGHAGLPNSMCATCHQQTQQPASSIPHSLYKGIDCTFCHTPQQLQASAGSQAAAP